MLFLDVLWAASSGPRGILREAVQYRKYGIGPLAQFVLMALVMYIVGMGCLQEASRFWSLYRTEQGRQVSHIAVHEDCYMIKGRPLRYKPGTESECNEANRVNSTWPLERAWHSTLAAWPNPLRVSDTFARITDSWEGKLILGALLGLAVMAMWNSTKPLRKYARDLLNLQREKSLLTALSVLSQQQGVGNVMEGVKKK